MARPLVSPSGVKLPALGLRRLVVLHRPHAAQRRCAAAARPPLAPAHRAPLLALAAFGVWQHRQIRGLR